VKPFDETQRSDSTTTSKGFEMKVGSQQGQQEQQNRRRRRRKEGR